MLTDNQSAILQFELSKPEYSGLSVNQAYAFLNDPQSIGVQVQVPYTIGTIVTSISPSGRAALVDWPNLSAALTAISNQDYSGILLWTSALLDGKAINQQDAGVILGIASAKESGTIITVPRSHTVFDSAALAANGFDPNSDMPNIIELTDFTNIYNIVNP